MTKETIVDLGPSIPWSEDPRSESMLENHKNLKVGIAKLSEQEILQEAKDLLSEHPGIHNKNISVQVENHCIILEGIVESKKEKKLANFLMENISGVRGVFNYLHLKM